jgi:serine/threonine-protein kinase
MGVVYKARHALLRRPTAIKLLAGQEHQPAQLARFEREVQLTSELTHPNTIAIYDYGRTPAGVFYYAMEYVEGLTFEQLVERSGPLPPARVVYLIQQAASAIAEAHDLGLVHRDIKPANLMLCRRGGSSDFVKVMDFGLVKNIDAEAHERGSTITHSTSVGLLGTPSYLSPEVIAGASVVDGRVDQYALGAVAYYLLVGEPVFTGQTVVEVCGHHLHTRPVPPSQRSERPVPAGLEVLVLRCLEKSPDARFASMRALVVALGQVTDAGAWSSDDASEWWRVQGDALTGSLREQARLAHAATAKAGA